MKKKLLSVLMAAVMVAGVGGVGVALAYKEDSWFCRSEFIRKTQYGI